MSESSFLIRSRDLPSEQSGELLNLTREQAGWEWMSFFVRRLQPGSIFRTSTQHEEAAFVLLSGICVGSCKPCFRSRKSGIQNK